MLPHVRFEQYVKKMEEMIHNITNHLECGERCSWQLLHENINKILNENIFRGIHLLDDNPGKST